MDWLRKGLLAVSMAGMMFSGIGLVITAVDGRRFEEWAYRFVVWQIEEKVREAATPEIGTQEGAFASMRDKILEKANLTERLLGSDFPERIAALAAELCVCRLDIEDREEKRRRFVEARENIASAIRQALKGDLELTGIGIATLNDLAAGYYIETVEGLKRDLQIFFGSNLLLFAMIGAGALMSERARVLVVPTSLLLVGTFASSGLYLFGQDWVSTILFHSWTGFIYLGWVALITALIADFFLNRARITLNIFSSLSPGPC
jgi:hypothetical protein